MNPRIFQPGCKNYVKLGDNFFICFQIAPVPNAKKVNIDKTNARHQSICVDVVSTFYKVNNAVSIFIKVKYL